MPYIITIAGKSCEAMDFAASELEKYLLMMSPEGSAEYRIGLFTQFGIRSDDIADPELDDAVYIDTKSDNIIAGSNPRSVLFAVYRFLYENGCRFLRPGRSGEYIPRKAAESVVYSHTADIRYRGQCIEGAVSIENMLESIDWSAKNFMNSYMLEFEVPFCFFDRWYSHRDNAHKKPEPVGMDTARDFKRRMAREIVKRGLILHDMGHGWTCEPFGINGTDWEAVNAPVPEETKQFFAMLSGRRELYGGIPLNTNICMSNPRARELMRNHIAAYTESHPEVGVLHVWLADETNNHCECQECTKLRPADYYVMLLNELDKELTRRGLKTRIAFIAYYDLFWRPEAVKLENQSRFILLFAPITRTYGESYAAEADKSALQPYERNRLKMPRGMAQNLAYLDSWREVFGGDIMVYEYHFMWDHYLDPGYSATEKVLKSDIVSLGKHGISGIIEDQTQRSFLPTPFPEILFAFTAFDQSTDTAALKRDVLEHCFGSGAERVSDYLDTLSACFDPAYMRGERFCVGRPYYLPSHAHELDAAAYAAKIAEASAAEYAKTEASPDVQQSLRMLAIHAGIMKRLAAAAAEKARGNDTRALELWKLTLDYAALHEDEIQPAFDVSTFAVTMRRIFGA